MVEGAKANKEFRRVVVLVADGFGVGEAPDASAYGDCGSNTLGHVLESNPNLKLPNLEKLGLGNLGRFKTLSRTENPLALVGRMAEKSQGKDTTTGHWEIAGLVTKQAFALFPNGFPRDLVEAWVNEARLPGFLGNYAASGTVIIEQLGEEHLKTLKPILYTSGDSVFQVAAHEEIFGLERLYEICEVARRLTLPYRIGRVIARPFIGTNRKNFKRTEHRRDYAVKPPTTCLDLLQKRGVAVLSVGKIEDIFAHQGITRGNHTGNNLDSLKATLDFMKKHRDEQAFIFTNLVDFDMLYGHRRDPQGFGRALSELDAFLPQLLSELTEDDCLLLTADHGCDPTYRGTDHTREYVPLVAYSPKIHGTALPDRAAFTDIAATLLEGYGISPSALPDPGESFLCKFRR